MSRKHSARKYDKLYSPFTWQKTDINETDTTKVQIKLASANNIDQSNNRSRM